MTSTISRSVLLATLSVVLVTSCNPRPAGQEPVVPLDGLFVLPLSLNLLTGERSQLSSTQFKNGEATSTTSTTAWSSANPAVATVSATGRVSAETPGRTTITGTVEGKTATVQVVVSAPSLQLLPLTMQLAYFEPAPAPDDAGADYDGGVPRYDSDSFVANRLDADGGRTNIASSMLWGSSDPSVASVVPDSGVVTAVGEGECVITGFLDGETVTGNVVVTPDE
ncbi:MAG: Ig-like domain-containing protein [Myxococcales bacterium]|nr:Ig-like domain-containing protein [Myxococcales bacterium]